MFAHFCRPARIWRPNVSVSGLHLCHICVSDICLSHKHFSAVSRGFFTFILSPAQKLRKQRGFLETLTLIPLHFIGWMPYRPYSCPMPRLSNSRDHLSLSKLSNVCTDLATLLPHPCPNRRMYLRSSSPRSIHAISAVSEPLC